MRSTPATWAGTAPMMSDETSPFGYVDTHRSQWRPTSLEGDARRDLEHEVSRTLRGVPGPHRLGGGEDRRGRNVSVRDRSLGYV